MPTLRFTRTALTLATVFLLGLGTLLITNLSHGGEANTITFAGSVSSGTAAPLGNTIQELTIPIIRPGKETSTASVSYTCTATTPSGLGYTPIYTPGASGTLSWGTGDAAPKTLKLQLPPLLENTYRATIICTLSSPVGATLGAITDHVIAVVSSVAPPPPATPTKIPTNCVVKDPANYPNWLAGRNYYTSHAPLNKQPANELWAWKFEATTLLNKDTNTGEVLLDSTSASPTVSITTSPCTYTPTTAGKPVTICQGSGAVDMHYAGNKSTHTDEELKSGGYCRLPALPSGQTFYYINFTWHDPPTSSFNTCTSGSDTVQTECSYFLLFGEIGKNPGQQITSASVPIPKAPAKPVPAKVPANCVVKDMPYGPGIQSFNPDGTVRQRIEQPGDAIFAFRMLRSSLPVGAGSTISRFSLYNVGGYTMTVNLSSTPCTFEPEIAGSSSKFTDYCQMYSGGAGQSRIYWTPDHTQLRNSTGGLLTGQALKNLLDYYQACVLPPPDTKGYLYFNTRFADHAVGGAVNPRSSTCIEGVEPSAPTSCSYYLFYE